MILAFTVSLFGGSTGTTALHTPNGSNAGTANGDYVTDAADGLDTVYRYFVEVPPALPRLQIDIFDADLGAGGTNEATASTPRDRDRSGGFTSTASYQLIGPDGMARNTIFSAGDDTGPVGGDNAWLPFFNATTDGFADPATTTTYSANSGTLSFSSDWIEFGDGAGDPNGGRIEALGGTTGFRFRGTDQNDSLYRSANLAGRSAATLSFEWTSAGLSAGDSIAVEVLDGPFGTATTLATYSADPSGYQAASFSIPASRISGQTTIRFRTSNTLQNNDVFLVRNIRINLGAPPAGHWEVRIGTDGGDDINALGLRAHDGTSGAGGTELNVYYDSFVAVGANPPNSGSLSRTYSLYPYITSGCRCFENDFDFDRNSGSTGSMSFASRTGAFVQSLTSASLSANDEWNRDQLSGWTSDQNATDYGVWSQALTITSYLVGGTPNGNYATIWNSNFLAVPTPTTNPQSNAFRTYLPTDGGGAPVKPYLEQVVRARSAIPPGVGQTKRFTITIRAVNPTSRAVTFSAANLVTANVPGGGAVYAGGASVSQGSIVSQPAVGGTGNVTWNPGSLAGGATAILAYDVNVTPTSAGQRIPVTATPASGNGTRAQWVDETGNTTQQRATYLFGPLCELAVTESLITPVVVASFDVVARGNHVDVEWATASELGTIGFNLYRIGPGGAVKINEGLIPSPLAPQGSHYRFKDRGTASAGSSYLLEEVTAAGETITHGPFAAGAGERATHAYSDEDFEAAPRVGVARPAPTRRLQTMAFSRKKENAVALLAGVRAPGLVRIDAATISSELNLPAGLVAADLRKGRFAVTDNGTPVPWFLAADGSLVFYGRKGETIYSDERIYRIEPSKRDATMEVVRVAPAVGNVSTFAASLDVEQDRFAALVLPLDAESDYWFWESVIPGVRGYDRKILTFDAPGLAEGAASIEVRLQGAMNGLAHRAAVRLNGAFLGEIEFRSLDAATRSFDVSGSLLRATGNELELSGAVPSGSSYDVYYADGFRVRYPRIASAAGTSIDVAASRGSAIVVGDAGSDPIVLDISNPGRPTLLSGAAVSNGTVALIPPAGSTAIHVAASVAGPSSIRTTGAAQLKRRNSADYVVIAPESVSGGAESLAELRRDDGLATMTVDLEQIYDEFAGGNATPRAIRDFIAWTQTSWSRAPKYFALAGGGTFDYRGLTKSAGLIPPMMTSTASGIFAADSLFGDVSGGDGIPEVAIGRIPVSTEDELLAYVAKLKVASRPGPMLFASDARDRGADFKAASIAIGDAIAAGAKSFVAIDDLGVTGARSALLAQWQQGASLVNWFGHGGLDRFSSSLLTSADVPLLTSGGGLPLVVAMSCSINRFEVGDVKSLGAELVNADKGGAVAVWSSSGSSVHGDAVALETELMKRIRATPEGRIGDLLRAALSAAPGGTSTAGIYLLLGDPAIRLSLPAETTNINPIATGE